MAGNKLIFRVHALPRMFQRNVGVEDVRHVLTAGETIEDYPEEIPYPSRLMLGWCGKRPLHVVAADKRRLTKQLSSRFTNRTPRNGSPTSKGESDEMRHLQAG